MGMEEPIAPTRQIANVELKRDVPCGIRFVAQVPLELCAQVAEAMKAGENPVQVIANLLASINFSEIDLRPGGRMVPPQDRSPIAIARGMPSLPPGTPLRQEPR